MEHREIRATMYCILNMAFSLARGAIFGSSVLRSAIKPIFQMRCYSELVTAQELRVGGFAEHAGIV